MAPEGAGSSSTEATSTPLTGPVVEAVATATVSTSPPLDLTRQADP